MKMPEKPMKSERRDDGGADLETQFILRLPEEPAIVLREALQSGAPNLKERLSISLENDLRKGMVRLDDRYMYAKVVDLPTIMESMKTIDKKSFYKTADSKFNNKHTSERKDLNNLIFSSSLSNGKRSNHTRLLNSLEFSLS